MFRGDKHVNDWAELVVDYLDGRLDPKTTVEIDRHLRDCAECAARLHAQRGMMKLLQETSLEDPPADLERRVLDELPFPSQAFKPLVRPPVKGPSTWWYRRIRPWIPATVAVAALLMAIVGYGLIRSNTDLSTMTGEVAAPSTSADKVAGATTARGEALGATTTTAGATTTVAAGETTTTSFSTTMYAATEDREAMITNLEAAQAPAYFVFQGTSSGAPGDHQSSEPTITIAGQTADTEVANAVSPEQAQAVVSQIVASTGLVPLDSTLSFGGPTFAAYVSRDDAMRLVDLLQSIGASLDLTVSQGMEPPETETQLAARLVERKIEFPVLLDNQALQSAAADRAFTTSTLVPASGPTDGGTELVPPDEAGTHVLIVIFLRN
jgi:anti-sigma factor RsiW